MENTVRDIINFKVLSKMVTGSDSRKIRKQNTAEAYADDIQELEDLITTWLKWKQAKHSK